MGATFGDNFMPLSVIDASMKYGDQETVELLWPGLEDWQCQCRRKEWEWWSLWMKWTSATTTTEKRKNRLRRDCLYLFWSGTGILSTQISIFQRPAWAQLKLQASSSIAQNAFAEYSAFYLFIYLNLQYQLSLNFFFHGGKVCHMTQLRSMRCETPAFCHLPWLEICHTEQIHICLPRNRYMAGYHEWSRGRAWGKPW